MVVRCNRCNGLIIKVDYFKDERSAKCMCKDCANDKLVYVDEVCGYIDKFYYRPKCDYTDREISNMEIYNPTELEKEEIEDNFFELDLENIKLKSYIKGLEKAKEYENHF